MRSEPWARLAQLVESGALHLAPDECADVRLTADAIEARDWTPKARERTRRAREQDRAHDREQ